MPSVGAGWSDQFSFHGGHGPHRRGNARGPYRVGDVSRSLRVGAFASVLSLGAIEWPPIAQAQVVLPQIKVIADQTAVDNGPVVTETTAGPVRGYQALTATTATRTSTPIEQIPQSIDVVPRSVIDDQQTLTISEALQNVSGVSGFSPLFLYGVNYKIRGFHRQ